MGCICSKAIARSMSIREELNHGFQNTNLAWEDIFACKNGNDQLFSILSSAKTRTNELRASSFTLPSIDDDLGTKYLVKALDLIPDIKSTAEVKSSTDFDGELETYAKFTRSKSYQMSREKELSGMSFETAEGLNEIKLDWREKSLRGSRSFHTVEEYDALLERIHKSNTGNTESFEDIHASHQFKSSDQKFLKNETVKEEFNDLSEGSFYPVEGDNTHESGWKRKAAAKVLKSLDVSAVEFPAITGVRRWKQAEGQVYSPGTYETPKFGSYNDMKTKKTREEEGGEDTVFSPELLAAFEDCVQQLQIEEDSILCHMDGYMRINDVNGE
ncbi:hypothetical protein F511_01407 [Dorcoceras hygrometricum]|uniref:Uncharacterized protein n=1 Tax=Dorcoceras hygrometricum TaxID=472368 RepID=A0A2Z7BLS1_9LAMI|nr:hypothetical protein F511_01407 [Dorcoceras hygrometricum]